MHMHYIHCSEWSSICLFLSFVLGLLVQGGGGVLKWENKFKDLFFARNLLLIPVFPWSNGLVELPFNNVSNLLLTDHI